MEYNPDGTMKQAVRVYPLQLYKRSGEIVVVNNDEERNAAIAAGASLKIWDREKHVESASVVASAQVAPALVAAQESAAVEPEPERKSRRSAR